MDEDEAEPDLVSIGGDPIPEHPGDATETSGSFDRRAALTKAGVGAGVVVGLVWTSPRIEGLSLRADYAHAASSPPFAEDQIFSADERQTAGLYDRAGSGAPNLGLGWERSPPGDADAAVDAYTITRSSDCLTTVDVVSSTIDDIVPTTSNRDDSAGPGTGPYAHTFQTVYAWSQPVDAKQITVHFAC